MVHLVDLEAGVDFEIAQEAMNNLCRNPYKFPKHKDQKSVIEMPNPDQPEGPAIRVPAIDFSECYKYLYFTCLDILITDFLKNAKKSWEKLNGGKPIGEYRCGNGSVTRQLNMAYWIIECSMTCIKDTTYDDIMQLLKEPSEIRNYFSFEIIGAGMRPRDDVQHKHHKETTRSHL